MMRLSVITLSGVFTFIPYYFLNLLLKKYKIIKITHTIGLKIIMTASLMKTIQKCPKNRVIVINIIIANINQNCFITILLHYYPVMIFFTIQIKATMIPTKRNNPKKKPSKAIAIPDNMIAIVQTIKNVIGPPPKLFTYSHAIMQPITNASTSMLKIISTFNLSQH